MVQTWLLLIFGLVILYLGAELLIRGAANLALRFGIPSLVVGLTVIAFGTSAPELVVGVTSGLRGHGDVAVGNVVGSNIFNVAVILGLSALMRPIAVNLRVLRVDAPIMVAVSAVMLFFLRDSTIDRIEAILLFGGLIVYISTTVYFAKKEAAAVPSSGAGTKQGKHILLDPIFIIAGLAGLTGGSHYFVKGAVMLAHQMHISEAVIGLTIVATGTSLPELAASVVAAIKKHEDLAVGNIIGSNLFNILSILGVSGSLRPLHANGITPVDLGVMFGLSALLLPLMRTGFKISRIEGGLLCAIYGGYLFYLWPK